jgi:hypothetical protein
MLTVGSEPVGDDGLCPAMAFQSLLDEGEGGGLVAGLGYVGFQHLTLVIHGSPELVHLPIDLYVDLVEMPSPVAEHAASRCNPFDTAVPFAGDHADLTMPVCPTALTAPAGAHPQMTPPLDPLPEGPGIAGSSLRASGAARGAAASEAVAHLDARSPWASVDRADIACGAGIELEAADLIFLIK